MNNKSGNEGLDDFIQFHHNPIVAQKNEEIAHLQKLCEEQKGELTRLKALGLGGTIQDILQNSDRMYSQLAEQRKETEEVCSVARGLRDKLATQTERVRQLEGLVSRAEYDMGEIDRYGHVDDRRNKIARDFLKQALNQESLGDGKDEYCTCGTNPRTWKTCRRHKEANESLGDGGSDGRS